MIHKRRRLHQLLEHLKLQYRVFLLVPKSRLCVLGLKLDWFPQIVDRDKDPIHLSGITSCKEFAKIKTQKNLYRQFEKCAKKQQQLKFAKILRTITCEICRNHSTMTNLQKKSPTSICKKKVENDNFQKMWPEYFPQWKC